MSRPDRSSAQDEPAVPEPVESPDSGARQPVETRHVALSEVAQDDERYQLRLNRRSPELAETLRRDGQLSPVLLAGAQPPYLIVDGFARVTAVRRLGWETIWATVHPDLPEEEALCLSFTNNVSRRNFTSLDRASIVWTLVHRRGRELSSVASYLGLSDRQVRRYLQLFTVDPATREAILANRITMAHAAALLRVPLEVRSRLIEQTVRQDLASDVLLRLTRSSARRGRPRSYLLKRGAGFTFRSFRFDQNMSPDDRRRIEDALEQALTILRSPPGAESDALARSVAATRAP